MPNKYDTLDDMGDLNEFANSLGTWPGGYFPKYSGKELPDIGFGLVTDRLRYPQHYPQTPQRLAIRSAWRDLVTDTRAEIRQRVVEAVNKQVDKVKAFSFKTWWRENNPQRKIRVRKMVARVNKLSKTSPATLPVPHKNPSGPDFGLFD